MRISAAGVNFLLVGEAGSNEEKGILDSGEPLESQVLKVARHGSKSFPSVDFLARVVPWVTIVTVEGVADRRGGLPIPDAVLSLQNTGARIFNTETDGATTVEAKNGSLAVHTYRGTETVVMPGGERPKIP